MAIIQCPECGGQVSDSAKRCPHCGYKRKKEISIKTIIVILIVVFFLVFCIFMKIKADREMEEMVMDTFFNSGDGVTITEIAESFEKAVDASPETETKDAEVLFETEVRYDENNSVMIIYTDDNKLSAFFLFDGEDKQAEWNRCSGVILLLSEMQEKLNDGKGKIVTIITTVSEGETEYGFLVFNDGEANELSNFPASYTGLQNQEDAVMEEYLYAYQQVSENMKNYIE